MAAAAVAVLVAAPVARGVDHLPNLRMAQLRELRIERTPDGHKLLRYTTVIVNVGAGPFELRGARPDTATSDMTVTQRIADDSAQQYHDVATSAAMFYAGDGHNHWHVRDLETGDIRPIAGVGPVRALAKHGFCFWDNTPFSLTLPGAPGISRYAGCGEPSDTAVTMGLSIGWGDTYPWNVAFQYVDVTGIDSGYLRLSTTVNTQLGLVESNTGDNGTWADLSLNGDTVSVFAYGPAASPTAFVIRPPAPGPVPIPFPIPFPR